jgi:hypothetical protein
MAPNGLRAQASKADFAARAVGSALEARATVGTGLPLRNLAPKSRCKGERCIENQREYRSLAPDWIAPWVGASPILIPGPPA